mmetsp:Transcript_40786/g.75869  ORF Transcript_40786/g.75869 Transcript_40786/m.75869 type:complete len:530 (-) Transcript_40786:36-1625(-)
MGRKCWIWCGRASAVAFMAVSGVAILYSFFAAQDDEEKKRLLGKPDAFVELFEWSWSDVALECEQFLGPKGFRAVLTSPPQEHVQGPGWLARYQPVTYNLTSRSGNESEFRAMVKRCAASGVAVYADVVLNHCGAGSGIGVGGSNFSLRRFPLYTPGDFHHVEDDIMKNCRIRDYNDKHQVQYCDLESLPDLCTGCSHVQDTMAAYLNRLAQMGVAGFRIDAAEHIDAKELGRILSRVDSSLYIFQDVPPPPGPPGPPPRHGGDVIRPSMYWNLGQVTEVNYGIRLGSFIKAPGRMHDLEHFPRARDHPGDLMPTEHAVVFIDNHNTQRGRPVDATLTYKYVMLHDLAVAFMLANPYGYPVLMSSYHFDVVAQGPPSIPVHGANGELNCGRDQPWVCEHRHRPVANMVGWRQAAGEDEINNFVAVGGNHISFCRGSSACIALNRAETAWHADFPVSVPSGHYCDIANSTETGCPEIHIGHDSRARIEIPPLSIAAFHVKALARPTQPAGTTPWHHLVRWARASGASFTV